MDAGPARAEHTLFVRLTHWATTIAFAALVVSGVAILLAHPRLYWGETGAVGAPSLLDLPLPVVLTGQTGWGRSLHFLAAWVVVVTGAAYVACGLVTGHFRHHLWPGTAGLTPRALRQSVVDHLSPMRRAGERSAGYNVLQQLTYLVVIAALFPSMIWTGLAMSPAVTSVMPMLASWVGGQQSARTIHFAVAVALVLFLVVHLVMIWRVGFLARVDAMITGRRMVRPSDLEPSTSTFRLRPSDFATVRRRLIVTGVSAAAGVSGVAAAIRFADRLGFIPPDHTGLYGAGETMTYAAHRVLTSRHSLAREFDRRQISAVIPVNGDPPETDAYLEQLEHGFRNWRLTVDGLVERPGAFSLAELKRMPSRSQITQQACEEGWSFIAEWTGVPLATLLNTVGVHANARYVVFYPFDRFWDSLDMADAWHPQTLLAYGMNGGELPLGHGAPLRLRVPRQLGYKSIKYLSRITVVADLHGIGGGLGSASPEIGYSWYAGI